MIQHTEGGNRYDQHGNGNNGPVQAHFDTHQLSLIHMACRHEYNALRPMLSGRWKRADKMTARLQQQRLTEIMRVCESVVPHLTTMRPGDVP